MTEELEQLLKNLKLRRMLSVYDEQLRAAEKAQVSYSEFVAGLLRSQWHDRQESALNIGGLGAIGRLCHGTLFHLCNLGRDADHDARMHERPALLRFLDEVAEHLLGHFEVGNHAIFQRSYNSDMGGRAAQHLLGLLADRLHFAGTVIESNG